jgi:hypothetical protein
MRIIALWNIAPALRDALLQHLQDFSAEYPGSHLEVLVQSSTPVPVTDLLREPAAAIAAIPERQGPDTGPSALSEGPFERAIAAILAHPDLRDRAIAKKIGVSHQTVGRARAALRSKPGAKRSKRPVDGPRGPERRRTDGGAP